jgi:hypothetical protein
MFAMIRLQDLEGHGALVAKIGGQVDLGHATNPQQGRAAIRPRLEGIATGQRSADRSKSLDLRRFSGWRRDRTGAIRWRSPVRHVGRQWWGPLT